MSQTARPLRYRLTIFPDDPRLVPSPGARQTVREVFPTHFAPEAHVEIETNEYYESFGLRSIGTNAATCRRCDNSLDRGWIGSTSLPKRLDHSLMVESPCCHKQIYVNHDIRLPWQHGFARFAMTAISLEAKPEPAVVAAWVAQTLQCEVRVLLEVHAGSWYEPVAD